MKKQHLKRHLNRFKNLLEKNENKYISFKVEVITNKDHKLRPYYETISDLANDNFSYNLIDTLLIELDDLAHESENLEEFKEKIDNQLYEIIDSNIDIYTKELTEWLNSDINNVYYISQALENHETKDGFQLLQLAQYEAISEIAHQLSQKIIEFLETK